MLLKKVFVFKNGVKSIVKTVPVIFVVKTVLIQYCLYYENYWNSLYKPQLIMVSVQ